MLAARCQGSLDALGDVHLLRGMDVAALFSGFRLEVVTSGAWIR